MGLAKLPHDSKTFADSEVKEVSDRLHEIQEAGNAGKMTGDQCRELFGFVELMMSQLAGMELCDNRGHLRKSKEW